MRAILWIVVLAEWVVAACGAFCDEGPGPTLRPGQRIVIPGQGALRWLAPLAGEWQRYSIQHFEGQEWIGYGGQLYGPKHGDTLYLSICRIEPRRPQVAGRILRPAR